MRKAQALARTFLLNPLDARQRQGRIPSLRLRHWSALLEENRGSTSPESRFWKDASTDEISTRMRLQGKLDPQSTGGAVADKSCVSWRSRAMSLVGALPKKRLYSRLNCDAL